MKRAAAVLITGLMIMGTSFAVLAAPSPFTETDSTMVYTDINGWPIPLAGLEGNETQPAMIGLGGGAVSPKTSEGAWVPVLSCLLGGSAAGMLISWCPVDDAVRRFKGQGI